MRGAFLQERFPVGAALVAARIARRAQGEGAHKARPYKRDVRHTKTVVF